MTKIIILSTCDEWKSYASFQLYGTWATTKASCQRLYKTIIEGIKNGTFAYEDESMSRTNTIQPNVETLVEIAKYLNVEIQDLFWPIKDKE